MDSQSALRFVQGACRPRNVPVACIFLVALDALIAVSAQSYADSEHRTDMCGGADDCMIATPGAGDGVMQPTQTAGMAAPPTSGGVAWLFDTSGFPPRWQCGTWTESLGWLHILSDIGIWGAYMAIPCVLAFFLFKRKMPMPHVTWLFVAFIASCGIGHLIEAVIFWQPVYRLAGVWKLVTATVSWMTVLALIPIIPRVLRWPALADINKRLKSEIADRERAELHLRSIYDAAPVGMLMVEADGTIALVNGELEEMFGYVCDELIGQQIEILLMEEDRDEHPVYRQVYGRNPVKRSMGADRNLYGRRKDGTRIPLDIGLTPLRTQDGLSIVVSVADISELQHSKAKLASANSELGQKNLELERFAHTASHDLKSPLVTIRGFVGHLARDIEDGRHDRLAEFVERIQRGTERMNRNINDLLKLSKVGQGQYAVELLDVRSIVEEVKDRLEQQIADAEVVIDVQSDIPSVWADRLRLVEIFENLVTNAIKYGCSANGECHIRIGGQEIGGCARLFVADSGPGIEEQYLTKIFDPFERLKTDQDGTGIGLAIVSRIAEAYNGRAWVESSPGCGAMFYVELPIEPTVVSAA